MQKSVLAQSCRPVLEAYKVMLRPILEYCSPIYHSMLTLGMSEDLERQQKTALKMIFGFGLTYEDLLAKANIRRLSDRREEACLNFAKKMSESVRFGVLFPKNEYEEDTPVLRNRKTFTEEFARSERLYRSPLYHMRRVLNSEEN